MSKAKSIPAISLETLKGLSPTFEMPVEIKVRGADPVQINVTCKALRKTEWAELRDKASDAMRKRTDAHIEKAKSDKSGLRISDVVSESMASDAEIILKFATAWSLEDKLSAESLQDLEDICGGAMLSIVEAYELAIYQNRLGN